MGTGQYDHLQVAADLVRLKVAVFAANTPAASVAKAAGLALRVARQTKIKPQRHELTFGRTHETEDAGLRRETEHGTVRRVVGSVDDPIRRNPQPEWNRHLPATID